MIKLVRTDDTDWNERVSTMIDVTRFGAHISQIKTAGAVLAKEFSELRPSEKYAWVHTLAIGSTEAYGPNRNADGFSEYWLKKKHDTFVKNAHLYRNHANKDPKKAIGIIKHSAYNPEMRRVELIIGYDKKKAADIVEKLARGEDVAGSMGCRIDYDVCSICGNKARSPVYYCDHMKKYAAQILDDGRQVYVDNPNPEFFDWSYVDRPADRIAFSFSKVASHRKAWKSSVDLAYEAGLTYPSSSGTKFEKISTLKKLSEIEKQVPVTLSPIDSALIRVLNMDNEIDEPVIVRLRSYNPCDVFSTLHKHKILLSPKNFLQLVAPATADSSAFDDIADAIQSALPGIFSQLLSDPVDEVDTVFDGDCGSLSSLPESLVQPLVDRFSFAEPVITKRIYRVIMIRPVRRTSVEYGHADSRSDSDSDQSRSEKKKSEKTSGSVLYPVKQYPEICTLAKLYAKYKLASAMYPTNINDPIFTNVIVFQNFQHIFS